MYKAYSSLKVQVVIHMNIVFTERRDSYMSNLYKIEIIEMSYYIYYVNDVKF